MKVAFLLALGMALLFGWGFSLAWLWAWLLAINAVTYATYGFDKHRAAIGRRRVAERTLLALALAGGSPGALAGMKVFRHKTAKGSFQLKFWALLLGQFLLVAFYVGWVAPRLR